MTGGSSGDGVRLSQDDPPDGNHGLRAREVKTYSRETSVSSYLPILDGRPAERLPPSFHRSQKPEKVAPRFAERRIFRKFIRDQNEKTCNPSGCRFLYFCENGPGVTAKAAAIDQHGRDMPPAPSRRVPHITGLFPPSKKKAGRRPRLLSKKFFEKSRKILTAVVS